MIPNFLLENTQNVKHVAYCCYPSLEFLICCSISKRFCLQWKAFDLLNKMRYILWVVALLGACDVTNNGRHLGFYQEVEIGFKPREVMLFCA